MDSGVEQLVAYRSHKPEVVGSSPAPATGAGRSSVGQSAGRPCRAESDKAARRSPVQVRPPSANNRDGKATGTPFAYTHPGGECKWQTTKGSHKP